MILVIADLAIPLLGILLLKTSEQSQPSTKTVLQ